MRAGWVIAALVLAGCASMESAGRNADRAPAPPPVATPAPQRAAPAPGPQTPAPAPQVAAPGVAAPAAPAPRREAGGGDIVVPGEVNRQVQPPQGDPRTVAERMADIRAWDECVTQVQAQGEADPMRPQLEVPEDYCAQALGMSERTAVPYARRR